MKKHLTKVLDEFIEKKIRVDKKLEKYKEQASDMRERFIDQTTLEKDMRDRGVSITEVDKVVKRKAINQKVGLNTARWLKEQKENLESSISQIQRHAIELRDLEIQQAKGFFKSPVHSKGADEFTVGEGSGKKVFFKKKKKEDEATLTSYIPISEGSWQFNREIHMVRGEKE